MLCVCVCVLSSHSLQYPERVALVHLARLAHPAFLWRFCGHVYDHGHAGRTARLWSVPWCIQGVCVCVVCEIILCAPDSMSASSCSTASETHKTHPLKHSHTSPNLQTRRSGRPLHRTGEDCGISWQAQAGSPTHQPSATPPCIFTVISSWKGHGLSSRW